MKIRKNNVIIFLAGILVVVSLSSAIVVHNRKNNLLELSLEALSEDEQGIKGHCHEEQNACLWICPNEECHAIYEAVGDHKGMGYNVSGVCSVCGQVAP